MDHLQGNLKAGNGVGGDDLDALRVVVRDGPGIHRRPELAIGKRKVRNRQPGVLMPHRRTQGQLGEDEESREEVEL